MQKTSFGFRVIDGGQSRQSEDDASAKSSVQIGLFPFGSRHTIIFVLIPGITEPEFLSLMQLAQPTFAVDLRPAPRFDIGRLTRQEVFQHFDQLRCKYLDPCPTLQLGVDDIRRWVAPALDAIRGSEKRTIMFFVSVAQDTDALRRTVCDAIGCASGEWQFFEVPNSTSSVRGLAVGD